MEVGDPGVAASAWARSDFSAGKLEGGVVVLGVDVVSRLAGFKPHDADVCEFVFGFLGYFL
jgi:hypothetical protein